MSFLEYKKNNYYTYIYRICTCVKSYFRQYVDSYKKKYYVLTSQKPEPALGINPRTRSRLKTGQLRNPDIRMRISSRLNAAWGETVRNVAAYPVRTGQGWCWTWRPRAWSWRVCGAVSTFSTLSQTSWRWTDSPRQVVDLLVQLETSSQN